jgi:hypothetical protein
MDIMAIASVTAGGAAFLYNKGCASVVNSGVGLIDITLNNPADAAECIIEGSSLGAVGTAVTLTHVSDTVKRVSTTLEAAGVATLSNAVPFTFSLTR